jgi:hypothetical protein
MVLSSDVLFDETLPTGPCEHCLASPNEICGTPFIASGEST